MQSLENRHLLAASLDVNLDQFITPMDALLVMNALSVQQNDDAVEINSRADTTGDGNVTPMDALAVINHLSAHGASSPSLASLEDPGQASATVTLPSSIRQRDLVTLTISEFQNIQLNELQSLTIDWGDGRVDEVLAENAALPLTQLHSYFDVPGSYNVQVSALRLTGDIDLLDSTAIDVVASSPEVLNQTDDGFLAEIFTSGVLGNEPDFRRIDPTINFDFSDQSLDESLINGDDPFAVRWTSQFTPDVSGEHTFHALKGQNDTLTLFVNGQIIIDLSTTATNELSATLSLEGDQTVDLIVEYTSGQGASVAKLLYENGESFKSPIPSDKLATPANNSVLQQGVLVEQFLGIPNLDIADLRSSPSFVNNVPNDSSYSPDFSIDTQLAQTSGHRVRGLITAPVDGKYKFQLSANSVAELWLSQSQQSGTSKLIASVDGASPDESDEIHLIGGQSYYIESLSVHDVSSPNELEVMWQRPDGAADTFQSISQAQLSPVLPVVSIHADVSQTTEFSSATDPIVFQVARNDVLGRDLTVYYSIGGDAVLGSDYTGLTGSVVIPKGDESISIEIEANQDSIDELNEHIVLRLAGSSSAGDYQLANEFRRQVIGTIVGEGVSGTSLLPVNGLQLTDLQVGVSVPNTVVGLDLTLPFSDALDSPNVLEVQVSQFVNPWDVQLAHILPNAEISTGDKLYASVWARSANPDGSDATVGMRLQELGSFFGVGQTAQVGTDWTQLTWPIEADFGPNGNLTDRSIDIRLGYQQQTVQLAEFSLMSLPQETDLSRLPLPIRSYQGRDFDSNWRSSAELQSETNRSNPLQIAVVDTEGNPVVGAVASITPITNGLPIAMEVSPSLVINNDGSDADLPGSQRYRNVLRSYFAALTDGGEAQWGPWLEEDQLPTNFLQWVIDQDLPYHGHSILWGELDSFPAPADLLSDYQQELTNNGEVAARNWLEQEIQQHISSGPSVVFAGARSDGITPKVTWWDVINHPVLSRDIWDIVGDEFMLDVIDAARNVVHPDTELIINESAILSDPLDGRGDSFFDLLTFLDNQASGDRANYDTIGFQGHFVSDELPSIQQVIDELARFESFDRRIQVTEFDVDQAYVDAQTQADFTRDVYLALAANENVDLFTLWGFWEEEHWRRTERAELFESDWTARPNGQWILDEINSARETQTLTSDQNGTVSFVGQSGSYDVRLDLPDGTVVQQRVDAGQTTIIARDLTVEVAKEHIQFDQDLSFSRSTREIVRSGDLIPIDVDQAYVLSAEARSGDDAGNDFDPSNRQYFGFASYDIDQNEIKPWHVLKQPGATDTYLLQDLNPGDTVIHLNDATGWQNAGSWSTRFFAWYGYTDSTGHTYPDFSYTRNVEFKNGIGSWEPGAVDFQTNTITLPEPWSGPLVASGTAVRNARSGATFNYSLLANASVPNEWTQYESQISGVGDGSSQFRPGTAFVQPIALTNYQQQSVVTNELQWRDVRWNLTDSLQIGQGLSVDLKLQDNSDSASNANVQFQQLSGSPSTIQMDGPFVATLTFPQSADSAPISFSYTTQIGDTIYEGFVQFELPESLTFGGEPEINRSTREILVSDQFVAVDTNQTYFLTGQARSGNDLGGQFDPANKQYFGFASYDVDRLEIKPWHVRAHRGSMDTVLTQPLSPGDTVVHLDDVTGWQNGGKWWSRSLAWYGYADSMGNVYEDYTYTRNVLFENSFGAWDVGAVDLATNTITLRTAWAGPVLAAGTAMRNATSGATFNYAALAASAIPNEWTNYSASISGIGTTTKQFRPGTAWIRPVILTNYQTPGGPENSVAWRQVDVTIAPEGIATFDGENEVSRSARAVLLSDQFIAIDTSQGYVLTGQARSGNDVGEQFDPANKQYFGFASYDVDQLEIRPWHVQAHEGAVDTTLAQPLSPGDTVVHLNDVTGWQNGGQWWSRFLAWYGYANSDGEVYPDYTYTRNVQFERGFGNWDPGAIDFNANTISLRVPWNGPEIAAGTAVRNSTSGASFNYAVLAADTIPNEWTDYSATVSGIGTATKQFRPGTAWIRPVILVNYQTAGGPENEVAWRNVRVDSQ